MEDAYFWLFWCATLSICAWKLFEGIWHPKKMLEWPFIASAMWTYFYVYMAFEAKITMGDYLPGNSATLGEFMPLVCLIGIILGWELGLRSRVQSPGASALYSLSNIWWIGMGITAIGAYAAYSVFFTTASQGGYDYSNTSAYWYLLFYIGYPGLALTVWAVSQWRDSSRWLFWLLTITALGVFIYPYIHNARRGPIFPAVLIFLVMPALAKKIVPNRIVFLGGLVGVGLLMMAFVLVRPVVYGDGTWTEAIQGLTINKVATEHGQAYDDNEFINNCHLIWTIFKDGKYQYGTGHLELLVHWIPHQLWKSKPILGEGYYSYDELWNDVERVTGFRLLGSGAAPGGVADSFLQYGFLTPFFYFAFSWLVARVYMKASLGENPQWQFCYVAFICASHWFVSQGLDAAFVPGMFFLAVPLVVFWFIGKEIPQIDRPRKRRGRRINEEVPAE